MPLQTYITQPLLPENFYHIYNRGNEKGTAITFDEDNYYFFLRRWKKYMLSYVDTLAYCILQDHYHIAVRIKPADEVLQAAARHLKVVRKDEWQRLQRKLEQLNLAGFPEDKNSSTSQQNEQDHDDDTVNLPGLHDHPKQDHKDGTEQPNPAGFPEDKNSSTSQQNEQDQDDDTVNLPGLHDHPKQDHEDGTEQPNPAGFPEDKNSSTSQQNEQDHDDDTVNLPGLHDHPKQDHEDGTEQPNPAGFPEDKNSSTSQQNEQDHDDDTVNLTGLLGLGHGHVHVHNVASRKHDIAKLLASHAVSSPRLSHLLDTLPLDMLTGLASWAVSERIRRFHLSYSKAINKQQNRRGSLMQKPFRRKLFKGKNNLKRLIRYIHNNPVHHGYVYDIGGYKWSSYNSFFSKEATSLRREEVISIFGGIKAFEEFHKKKRFDIFGEP